MADLRRATGNPSLLPDATYFALQRMNARRPAADGPTSSPKQPAGSTSGLSGVGKASPSPARLTNRVVETAISRGLGWLHAITKPDKS